MTQERHVFINCPFDASYRSLLRAIIFAVHDCGFRARSALEIDDSAEVRLNKIIRIVDESPFGIHDISRVQLDKKSGLPRFNMPLELGLFLGARAFGDKDKPLKRCIVLDEDRFRYQRFCSDLAGQDIHSHGGKPDRAIEIVRNWLSTTPPAEGVVIPSGSVIAQRYREFRLALPAWCAKLQLDRRRLTFTDDVALIVAWLREYPWLPANSSL